MAIKRRSGQIGSYLQTRALFFNDAERKKGPKLMGTPKAYLQTLESFP